MTSLTALIDSGLDVHLFKDENPDIMNNGPYRACCFKHPTAPNTFVIVGTGMNAEDALNDLLSVFESALSCVGLTQEELPESYRIHAGQILPNA